MKLLKAIDYIETRLTAEVTLADIARAAGLSSFHFSRMFRALTGETVSSYLRRRRLTEAARRLIHRDERLIELALTYGFESQAAFSRAFKRQFGVPPGAYRKAGQAMPWAYRPTITLDDIKLEEEFRTMEPRIVEKPAFHAVGMPADFNQENTEGISDLWTTFWKRHEEIANPVEGHCLGLCIGADDDNFTYAPALEVTNVGKVPEGMSAWDVGAQTYAVFTVPLAGKEPISTEIGRAHSYIWKTWLPGSAYRSAEAPDFEYYDERFDPETLSGEIDIYIPIKPK